MIATNSYHSENSAASTEIIVRPMRNDDIIPYCSLFQVVFLQEPWNEKWTISQIKAIITRHMSKKGFIGLVATTLCRNIGYLTGFRLWLVPSIFYMDQLFVSANYQGLKIGKKLLIETEQHLKSQGVSRIFLLTKSQSYAEVFYVKNKYTPFLCAIRIKGKSIFYKHL